MHMEASAFEHEAPYQIDTSEAVANLLSEFLEVAFHYILYIRGIYSPLLFEQARKYNIPVQVCRHPKLNQYIKQVLNSLSPMIEKNEIQRVVLAVIDKEHWTVEAFNFSVQNSSGANLEDDKYLLELESHFRSFLLKISVCNTLLKPLPEGCTFMVQAVTKLSSAANMEYTHSEQEFPWIILDQQEHSINNSTVAPLKSVSTGIVQMQLYVEEAQHHISSLDV
ncbi:mitotic spindle assembly checkpoint protein MAD2B-like [Dysidea avara]|uniref:mitotic spindle assembly checkpoint protein MAD2B-like n=1 Tax=Dysidea avara TaxID=196820 RepID=UPI0033304459